MPDIRLAGTPQDYTAFGGTYTANTGNNRVVVAVVGYEHANSVGITNPQLNMTMGSVPFIQLGLEIVPNNVGGGGAAGIAYIKEANIPAGAQTISGSPSPGSAGGGYAITLYTLENVDQINPIFYSVTNTTAVSTSSTVNLIKAAAGGFAIQTGCSGTVGVQPFSVSDTTWTERRDYRNIANDFGFYIYDKFYSANKTETLNVTCSAGGRSSLATASFNPFVSNKVRFDTSANGFTRTIYNTGANNTTIDASVPSNVQAGDLMLAVLSTASGESISLTIPSGWTEIANNYLGDGDFTGQTWVGWKIANTAEPSTYTWTANTANIRDDQSFIFRILGHDGRTNPIDVIGTFGSASSTIVTSPSITTTKNDSMAVWILTPKRGDYLIAEDTNYPTNTTGILLKRSRDSSFGITTGVAYEYRKFAGATGSRTWSVLNTSAYQDAIGFAIKQAPYSTVQAERLIETGKVRQYTDNFNRADNVDGLSSLDWNTRQGSLRISNNEFYGFGACCYGDVDSSVVDFSDDHSAQITVKALGTADHVGPAVRVTANGCYAIKADGFNSGDRRIQYINGTTLTTIGTVNIVPVVGDILKLTVQGSVITAYKNGVQVDQVSNTAYTTGQPGIFYSRGNINTSKGDDFYAEDLNSPTSGTMVKMYDDGTIRAGYFSEKEYLDRIKYHYDGDVWAGKFIESE